MDRALCRSRDGWHFAGLSDTTAAVIHTAMAAAKRHGTVVSYDLNYRTSLWKAVGGLGRARDVNRALARHVDVMIGNEGHYPTCLGVTAPGAAENLDALDCSRFKEIVARATTLFPGFQVVAATLREDRTASLNDWGAIAWADGEFARATPRPELEILDRVGGGDSFASGLIFGLLSGSSIRDVEYGAAHGALAMTTPGDASMATRDEVERLASGGVVGMRR